MSAYAPVLVNVSEGFAFIKSFHHCAENFVCTFTAKFYWKIWTILDFDLCFLHLNYIYMPFCFTVSTAFTRGPTTQHSNNSHCLELLTQAPTQTLTCSLSYPQHKVVQAGSCGLECDLTLVCLRWALCVMDINSCWSRVIIFPAVHQGR